MTPEGQIEKAYKAYLDLSEDEKRLKGLWETALKRCSDGYNPKPKGLLARFALALANPHETGRAHLPDAGALYEELKFEEAIRASRGEGEAIKPQGTAIENVVVESKHTNKGSLGPDNNDDLLKLVPSARRGALQAAITDEGWTLTGIRKTIAQKLHWGSQSRTIDIAQYHQALQDLALSGTKEGK